MDAMSIWRDIRNTLEDKPYFGYVVAGVIMFVAISFLISWQLGGDDGAEFKVDQQWFYNEDTGELHAVSINEIPPKGPSVAANVVGCGGCSKPFISYLYKFTPEAQKAKIDSLDENLTSEQTRILLTIVVTGRMVRSEKGGKDSWVKSGSEKSIDFLSYGQNKCKNASKSMHNCHPGKTGSN